VLTPKDTRAASPEQVLEVAVAELRDLPYSYWRQAVEEGEVFTRPIALPQGGTLQLEVRPRWNRRGTSDIRVGVTVKGRWRHRQISGGFTITPANQFV
jgi:hypothetical protein